MLRDKERHALDHPERLEDTKPGGEFLDGRFRHVPTLPLLPRLSNLNLFVLSSMTAIDTALKIDDLPVGESRCLNLEETQIGLFRTAEGVYAIENECPHRGAPLNDGFVLDGVVTCRGTSGVFS